MGSVVSSVSGACFDWTHLKSCVVNPDTSAHLRRPRFLALKAAQLLLSVNIMNGVTRFP